MLAFRGQTCSAENIADSEDKTALKHLICLQLEAFLQVARGLGGHVPHHSGRPGADGGGLYAAGPGAPTADIIVGRRAPALAHLGVAQCRWHWRRHGLCPPAARHADQPRCGVPSKPGQCSLPKHAKLTTLLQKALSTGWTHHAGSESASLGRCSASSCPGAGAGWRCMIQISSVLPVISISWQYMQELTESMVLTSC